MSTPLEMMLDGVEWKALPPPDTEDPDGLPYVTHEGVLHIGEAALDVFQLSNGQRVISEDSMMRWLGGDSGVGL